MKGLHRVPRLRARLAPFRWDWAEANDERIGAHWAARRARQPALFDGRCLMVSSIAIGAEEAEAVFYETGYARLLAHMDFDFPDPSVRNGFAMGALRGSDGGYLLGVMAPHTANAGRLYFPAGTPDPSDVRPDGTVDLGGSIVREIGEETGFMPDEVQPEEGWTLVGHGGRLAFMREVRLRVPAEAAAERIRAFLAADPQPELSEIAVVRSEADLDDPRMPAFLPIYLRDAFGRG